MSVSLLQSHFFGGFNGTTDKEMIYTDSGARADSSASVTVPIEWVGVMTALHIVTTEYTQLLSKSQKLMIIFKACVELAKKN
jgi:hypothetical protein